MATILIDDAPTRAGEAAAAPKKVFIKTFGCQMNVYDSERMADALAPAGFTETDTLEDADLVILNTCHIREKAAEKVYSELGRIRLAREARRRRGGDCIIAVAGCVAQAEGEELVRRAPAVDIVVGPQSYHRLPDLLKRRAASRATIIETEFPAAEKFETLPAPKPRAPASAFLTVQEGCDKFCTFCVVPYTRGSEYSRPVAQILDEAKRLAERGVKEITLLGQNVNAYHGAGPSGKTWDLAQLLGALSNVDGVERLRFTTSHPNEMTDALIAAHRDLPKLMPYLHLPFQAGSDRILKADESQAHDGRLFPHRGKAQGRAARSGAFDRHHCGLSRRKRHRFPGNDAGRRDSKVHPGLFVQRNSCSPRNPRSRSRRSGQRERQNRSSSPAAILAQCSADGVQREHGGPGIGRTREMARQEGGADRGPVSLSASRACRGRSSTDGKITPVEIMGASQNSLRAVIKNVDALAPHKRTMTSEVCTANRVRRDSVCPVPDTAPLAHDECRLA